MKVMQKSVNYCNALYCWLYIEVGPQLWPPVLFDPQKSAKFEAI